MTSQASFIHSRAHPHTPLSCENARTGLGVSHVRANEREDALLSTSALNILLNHSRSLAKHLENPEADPRTLANVCVQTGQLVLTALAEDATEEREAHGQKGCVR